VQAFVYQDSLKISAELNVANQIISRFVYAGGINVPTCMIKNGITYRIITDHLGSPRFVVNGATGAVAQQLDYDEFGNVILDTNPGFQPFGFSGGLYDSQTQLVRFGARDYDAQHGRWTSKDPIRFSGGINFYSYCNADPVNFCDWNGMDPKTVVVITDGAGFGTSPLAANSAAKHLEKGGWTIKKMTAEEFTEAKSLDFQGLITAGHGDETQSAMIGINSIENLLNRSKTKLSVVISLSCQGDQFSAKVHSGGNTTPDALILSYWGYSINSPGRTHRINAEIDKWIKNPAFTVVSFGHLLTDGAGTAASSAKKGCIKTWTFIKDLF